ncbi:hypothetical protein ETA_32550 [Erwinia tasmaniensis Et1/99]|uniref:Uncharacterized protein n=1 Tax=Erwinia tasmaniensis (strain DSM 17950 / CFBP 7177 / CIP 109463 / NCPPB 4357 / Et1/99) TaxID=465817 RepID=B2VJS4_ERWT9|nr:hypothetical protein ETA_32550 [Erwinia tasmaniensis Et1/99]
MIMIIIAMRFQQDARFQLKKHDIAHIASNIFSQHGCWLFFVCYPPLVMLIPRILCRPLRRII